MPKTKTNGDRHVFFENAIFLFGFVVVLWAVEIVDQLLRFIDLDQYGVVPRERSGLLGIFLSPFLHGNFAHLIGNTLPLLVLGGLVLLSGRATFLVVTIVVTIVAGLGIWLFAPRYQVHIGASSLVFGYLGFLLLSAWFTRDWREAFVAVVAGLLYGGLVLTLLRHTPGISWHGHAFGFAGGVLCAWGLSERGGPETATRRP